MQRLLESPNLDRAPAPDAWKRKVLLQNPHHWTQAFSPPADRVPDAAYFQDLDRYIASVDQDLAFYSQCCASESGSHGGHVLKVLASDPMVKNAAIPLPNMLKSDWQFVFAPDLYDVKPCPSAAILTSRFLERAQIPAEVGFPKGPNPALSHIQKYAEFFANWLNLKGKLKTAREELAAARGALLDELEDMTGERPIGQT
jgi:hypothetical protein